MGCGGWEDVGPVHICAGRVLDDPEPVDLIRLLPRVARLDPECNRLPRGVELEAIGDVRPLLADLELPSARQNADPVLVQLVVALALRKGVLRVLDLVP